ncbi:MAG: hypothetical protein U0269_12100 [Polyangiales bacterium]
MTIDRDRRALFSRCSWLCAMLVASAACAPPSTSVLLQQGRLAEACMQSQRESGGDAAVFEALRRRAPTTFSMRAHSTDVGPSGAPLPPLRAGQLVSSTVRIAPTAPSLDVRVVMRALAFATDSTRPASLQLSADPIDAEIFYALTGVRPPPEQQVSLLRLVGDGAALFLSMGRVDPRMRDVREPTPAGPTVERAQVDALRAYFHEASVPGECRTDTSGACVLRGFASENQNAGETEAPAAVSVQLRWELVAPSYEVCTIDRVARFSLGAGTTVEERLTSAFAAGPLDVYSAVRAGEARSSAR